MATTTPNRAIALQSDEMRELLNDKGLKERAQMIRLSNVALQKAKDGQYVYSDQDLIGLAIAERITGLSAVEKELHCIPGVGVMPATAMIVGSAIQSAKQRGDHLTMDFFDVIEGTPEFAHFEKGDTVRMLRARSSSSLAAWNEARLAFAKELRAAGFNPGTEILDRVDERFGTKPSEMIVYGVVCRSEKTYPSGDPVKENPVYSWRDRADKRAIAAFIRKHGYSIPSNLRQAINDIEALNKAMRQPPEDVSGSPVVDVGPSRDPAPLAPSPDDIIEHDEFAGNTPSAAPEPSPASRPTPSQNPNATADLKSDAPFGKKPDAPAEPPAGDDLVKSARARWSKAANALSKAKRAPEVIDIKGFTDPAAIEDAAAKMEALLNQEPQPA